MHRWKIFCWESYTCCSNRKSGVEELRAGLCSMSWRLAVQAWGSQWGKVVEPDLDCTPVLVRGLIRDLVGQMWVQQCCVKQRSSPWVATQTRACMSKWIHVLDGKPLANHHSESFPARWCPSSVINPPAGFFANKENMPCSWLGWFKNEIIINKYINHRYTRGVTLPQAPMSGARILVA